MKPQKLLFLFAVLPFCSFSQTQGLFDRVNGVKTDGRIYIIYKPKDEVKFRYQIDDKEKDAKILKDYYFNVKNKYKNDVQIFTAFYNPLRHTIKSSAKDLQDPEILAASNWISNLPEFGTFVVPKIESSVAQKTQALSDLDGDGVIPSFKGSVLLYEWIYKFSEIIDPTKTGSSDYETFVNTINKIQTVETYLYGKVSLDDPKDAKGIPEWVKSINTLLAGVDNEIQPFKDELTSSETKLKKLLAKKEEAETILKELIALLSTKFDAEVAPFITSAAKTSGNFKTYSSTVALLIPTITKDKFDAHDRSLKTISDLNDKLNLFLKDFTIVERTKLSPKSLGIREDHNFNLDWNGKTMKEISYEVKDIDEKGNESTKPSTTSFTVARRLGVYPFVSTGVLYTDFSYPNYALTSENGVSKVAETKETKVGVRPSVFLNLLIGNLDPLYPFLQVGVSTGSGDALFPVGIGFTMTNSFSISGGFMFGYRNELSNLKVGSIVKDEAELQNDLSKTGFKSWYFSINYSLSKKSDK